MGRVAGLAAAFAAAAFVVVWVFGLIVQMEAQSFGITDRSDLENLGRLGNFLNVRYGVPIAIIAGLIGAAITVMLERISTRQGEVDILNFAEQKSDTITSCFRPFAESVIKSIQFARKIDQQYVTAHDHSGEEDASETAKQRFCRQADTAVAQFRDELQSLQSDAEAVWSNPYTLLVAESGLDIRPVHAQRLAELAALGRGTNSASRLGLNGGGQGFFEPAPKVVISQLDRLVKDLTVERAFNILSILPPAAGLRMLDVAGAIAGGQFCELSQPRKLANGRRLEGVFLNYGAAYLLMLVHALPRRTEVAELIDRLLERRSTIARNFLEKAGPDWSLYAGAPDWIAGFDDYARPYAFAYAVIRDGDRTYAERYNESTHGHKQ